MRLERNRILVRLVEEFSGDSGPINLLEILSGYTPVDKTTALPNVPLVFDKDAIFQFILRALAKQFEGGIKFFVLNSLSEFDRVICDTDGSGDPDNIPSVYKLVLQLLVHWSKIASDDRYDVRRRLEKDLDGVCREMVLPLNRLPEFVRSPPATRSRILKVLTRPFIIDLFIGELERYKFTDLCSESVKVLLNQMVIYETDETRWSVYGWTVMDGIVLMLGALPDESVSRENYWANVYSLSMRESIHYLAGKFSKNFGFSSSPGKDREQFKDPPDPTLAAAAEGGGLEFAVFGMQQVNWFNTPSSVAKVFVERVEDDQHIGRYLSDDECAKLIPEQFPCSYSGMSVNNSGFYYSSPRF